MIPYTMENWAKKLHVVAVISNTQRYNVRFELYKQFEERMKCAGVPLWTVECVLGERSFSVTEASNPCHIQLRTSSELWHKENMMNVGVLNLPPEAEYIAWIDADIGFVRPDWPEEAVQLLQRYPVIQLFSRIADLNPTFESFQTHKGFGWCYHNEPEFLDDCYTSKRGNWHPGFAWAMRRETYDAIGGFYALSILGSADRYMAHGFIGDAGPFIKGKGFSEPLVRSVLSWQDRAYAIVKGNVGFLPGTIYHFWHGSKKNRRYIERWEVLISNQFDPYTDVYYAKNGLLEFTGNKPKLERDVTQYFQQRNEDSIDFE